MCSRVASAISIGAGLRDASLDFVSNLEYLLVTWSAMDDKDCLETFAGRGTLCSNWMRICGIDFDWRSLGSTWIGPRAFALRTPTFWRPFTPRNLTFGAYLFSWRSNSHLIFHGSRTGIRFWSNSFAIQLRFYLGLICHWNHWSLLGGCSQSFHLLPE